MVCFVVTQHSESRVSHSVFATPKHLAFRLPKKIPFPKTVICYLLFVTQKIRFPKLSTVNCNAWCELALSKKQKPVLVF